jgi:hypothetical protein
MNCRVVQTKRDVNKYTGSMGYCTLEQTQLKPKKQVFLSNQEQLSTTKEISNLIWKLTIHYRIHNSQLSTKPKIKLHHKPEFYFKKKILVFLRQSHPRDEGSPLLGYKWLLSPIHWQLSSNLVAASSTTT